MAGFMVGYYSEVIFEQLLSCLDSSIVAVQAGLTRKAKGSTMPPVPQLKTLLLVGVDPSAEELAAMQKGIYTPYMPNKHILLLDSNNGGRTWTNFRQLTTTYGQSDGFPAALSDGTVVVIRHNVHFAQPQHRVRRPSSDAGAEILPQEG